MAHPSGAQRLTWSRLNSMVSSPCCGLRSVDIAIAEVVPTKATAEGRRAGTCAPLQFGQNKEVSATWAFELAGNPAFGRG